MGETGEVVTTATPSMKDPGERAPRYEIGLPLRYRSLGEREWHEAQTENISRSGILFRGPFILDLDTPVEMTFTLKAGSVASAVRCRGRVVRTVLPGRNPSAPGMAATISRYRFLRRARQP